MNDRKIDFEFSLTELGLLGAQSDHDFDNLTLLASEILETPVSLISIIDYEKNRQAFKSQTGLSEPIKSAGQTPLSHSFCKHVASRNQPLVVANAREHELVQDNPSIEELGVISYLGMPIHTPDNNPIGALCVIDGTPRVWSSADQKKLARIADCVDGLIRLRAAQKRSEKLQCELQEFSSALSHDIKSPIRSLVLFHREIEESLGSAINSDVKQLLDMCHGATDRATVLVENILNFTRLFDDISVFESVDVSMLVKEVIVGFEDQIKRTNAQITIETLPVIHGNKTLLQALLTELIANALIYAQPKQSPTVQISSQLSSDGAVATLCIKDNGIGIAPKYHKRVFRLFERLHLASEFPGHGIGLTLCQRIVGIHSGAIEIQSTVGKGTNILVDLPVSNHE